MEEEPKARDEGTIDGVSGGRRGRWGDAGGGSKGPRWRKSRKNIEMSRKSNDLRVSTQGAEKG